MSSDLEMEAVNAQSDPLPASGSTAAQNQPVANIKPRRDYSLPSSFRSLLVRPLSEVIAELIPLAPDHNAPVAAPLASRPRQQAGEAFVSAFQTTAETKTEKGGDAHASTNVALVDLFFDMAPPAQPKHLQELLEKAYVEDPLATTKLIFQTRSIHEGKGFKEGFWVAAGWLWDKHPRTFIENLHVLVDPTCKRDRNQARDNKKAAQPPKGVATLDEDGEIEANLGDLPEYPSRPHGTFDDLIDLLVLHISDELKAGISEVPSAVDEGIAPHSAGKTFKQDRLDRKAGPGTERNRRGYKMIAAKARKASPKDFKLKLAQCGSKDAKHKLFARRLESCLDKDSRLKALYCAAVDLFLTQLRADLALLDKHRDFLKQPVEARKPFLGTSSPHLFGISYAAKWVPSPGKSGDKQLHFATALALLLFPGEGDLIARQRLQREVLSPLRDVLKVPETKMGKGDWKIDYTKVPSRAMARYAASFIEHDQKGFDQYITKVESGRYAISGASLFPHEILIEAMDSKTPILGRLADMQWTSMVESIRSSSKSQLQNCLAIADVSGSMGALGGDKKHPSPMSVCIALTLLLGELAAPPWNGLFFTFSTSPSAQYIDPKLPLSTRANTLHRADWHGSTNFYKVFDLILAKAKDAGLGPEEMVQKLFILSDMQFDQCTQRKAGDTEYTAIKRKYTDAGYTLPELIFWNLAPRDAGAPKPVRADQDGVSLLSGFSGSQMKYFLGEAAKEDEAADAELAKAMADDWEAVDAEDEDGYDEDEEDEEMADFQPGGPSAANAARRKAERDAKKNKDPLTTVKKILGAESFSGVKVVD